MRSESTLFSFAARDEGLDCGRPDKQKTIPIATAAEIPFATLNRAAFTGSRGALVKLGFPRFLVELPKYEEGFSFVAIFRTSVACHSCDLPKRLYHAGIKPCDICARQDRLTGRPETIMLATTRGRPLISGCFSHGNFLLAVLFALATSQFSQIRGDLADILDQSDRDYWMGAC
jgi:hypothetical protein